jgi:hypothetical protein
LLGKFGIKDRRMYHRFGISASKDGVGFNEIYLSLFSRQRPLFAFGSEGLKASYHEWIDSHGLCLSHRVLTVTSRHTYYPLHKNGKLSDAILESIQTRNGYSTAAEPFAIGRLCGHYVGWDVVSAQVYYQLWHLMNSRQDPDFFLSAQKPTLLEDSGMAYTAVNVRRLPCCASLIRNWRACIACKGVMNAPFGTNNMGTDLYAVPAIVEPMFH